MVAQLTICKRGENVDDEVDQGEGRTEKDYYVAIKSLKAWMRTMSNTALIGVLIGTLTITSFLVLGVELLKLRALCLPALTSPYNSQNCSPRFGAHWLLANDDGDRCHFRWKCDRNQDGWARSFADITLLLPLEGHQISDDARKDELTTPKWMQPMVFWRSAKMGRRQALKIFYLVSITGVASTTLILAIGDPVKIMSFSGVIAAVHTPFIVYTTFALNLNLPDGLRPSLVTNILMVLAGLFYTVFMMLYLVNFWASACKSMRNCFIASILLRCDTKTRLVRAITMSLVAGSTHKDVPVNPV